MDQDDKWSEANGGPRPAWAPPMWRAVCCPGCGDEVLGDCHCLNEDAPDPEDIVTCDGCKWHQRETWLADKLCDEISDRLRAEWRELSWYESQTMAATAVRTMLSWQCESIHAEWDDGIPPVTGIEFPWIAELDGVS